MFVVKLWIAFNVPINLAQFCEGHRSQGRVLGKDSAVFCRGAFWFVFTGSPILCGQSRRLRGVRIRGQGGLGLWIVVQFYYWYAELILLP